MKKKKVNLKMKKGDYKQTKQVHRCHAKMMKGGGWKVVEDDSNKPHLVMAK